jgi:Fe/S biogenesis protein NfuA
MVLTVTEPARDKILELRAQEEAPDTLGLRIEVTGVQGVEYTYDLTFDPVADADVAAGDLIETQGELPVIIPVDSLDALKGATLDMPSSASNGLVLRNPNRPDPLSGAHIELSGTTDEKVRQLLDGQINPALAMHGGFAALDRVEGDVVYVTMGGGCQGCAVSAMTLREGIARSIKEAIPEVSELGENPYYT